MFENLMQDVQYAVRLLTKSPVFTAVAIFSLALGIGANSVVFSVFHTLLFQPLPVEKPEELVSVFTASPTDTWGTTSYADYVDLQSGVGAFRELIGYTVSRFRLDINGEGEASLVLGERVSPNYFSTLGAKPILGHVFTAQQDSAGPRVAVISEKLWRRSFAADPGIAGRSLRLNGETFTVVGVVPEGFRDTLAGLSVGVWIPIVTSTGPLSGELQQRGHRDLLVLGRLRPGAKIAEASAQMQGLAARLQQAYPETNKDKSFRALSAEKAGVHPRIREILSALGIFLTALVGIVLVIACLNLANLLLAKAWGRQREIGIRLAIGATRKRLIRQLLVESLLLSLAGGAVGLLLAFWATGLIRHFQPPEQIPIALEVGIDPGAIGFTLLLSLLTGVLFGLAPALAATRPDLNSTLKNLGGQPRGKRRRMTLRNLLVIAQVSVSVVLLIGASLFLRSLGQLKGTDTGFNTHNVLLVSLDLKEHDYDAAKAAPFLRNLLSRVQSLPGVRAASLAATVPLGFERKEASIRVPGQPGVVETLSCNLVSPDYFRSMDIPLIAGRDFGQQDVLNKPKVIIINEAMAHKYWPGQNAVGKRLSDGDNDFEVVGVVRTTKYRFLGESPTPYVYTPLFQDYSKAVVLHVRSEGEPLQLAGPVRQAVESLDPRFQALDATTLEDQVAFALLPRKIGGVIFIVSGLLALGLASMGIYGVISYSIRQRFREMAIRMSLGAQPGNVLRLVIKESMVLVTVGIVVGLVVAFPIMALVGSSLYGVSYADPLSFLGVIAVLATAALAATYLPARRATSVDPLIVMRHD